MSLRLAGLGWVTPLGATVEEVWEKMLAGAEAEATTFAESLGGKSYQACQVPPATIAEAARHPRLRRSSAISRFAVVAGLSALRNAGLELNEASAARTALLSIIGSLKLSTWPLAFQVVGCMKIAASMPTIFSSDNCVILFHQ